MHKHKHTIYPQSRPAFVSTTSSSRLLRRFMYRNVHFGGSAIVYTARPVAAAAATIHTRSTVRSPFRICAAAIKHKHTHTQTQKRIRISQVRSATPPKHFESDWIGALLVFVTLWVIRSHTSSIHVHTIAWTILAIWRQHQQQLQRIHQWIVQHICERMRWVLSVYGRLFTRQYTNKRYSLLTQSVAVCTSSPVSFRCPYEQRSRRFVSPHTSEICSPFRSQHTYAHSHERNYWVTWISDTSVRSHAYPSISLEYGGVSVSA